MKDDSGVMARPVDVASLARTQGDALVRFAYVVCGDADLAQDLVQGSLLSMLERPTASIEDPLGYARRAIVNRFVDERRRLDRRKAMLGRLGQITSPQSVSAAALSDRDLMRSALEELNGRERAAIVLRYYADMDDDAIAAWLHCRPTTVRSLLSRGRAKLKEQFTNNPHGGTE